MVTILTYHGVTDLASRGIENFQQKHLPVSLFEQQMRYLRRHERVRALAEVVEAYRRGEELDGVVVTFDDGYRNNYTVALPVLERLETPVTFFFSTGFIGTDRMFWVDEVEMLIDQSDAEAIDLSDHGLGMFRLGSAPERMDAVTRIKASLKRLDDRQRARVLDDLKARIQVPCGYRKSPNYTLLSWPEVQALAQSRWVEVGAHAVDHPILTRIGPDEVEHQVRQSKRDLERWLDREVTQFAYPNGGPGDYDAAVMEVVKAAGFRCACTTLPGKNTAAVGLFELRRTMVGFCGEPFPFPLSLADDG